MECQAGRVRYDVVPVEAPGRLFREFPVAIRNRLSVSGETGYRALGDRRRIALCLYSDLMRAEVILLTRIIWVTYLAAKKNPLFAGVANRFRPIVRRLLYPRGVEFGLFGTKAGKAGAHLPNVKAVRDPQLLDLIRKVDSFPPPFPLPKLDALDKPRFSVVINTLNRASSLIVTLRALQQQTWLDFEVIVVVGPCTDDTMLALHPWAGIIKIGYCEEPNLSKSRNIGISLCVGDVVCFLDDDAIPEPTWLERLARAWTQSNYVGIGGSVRNHVGVTFQCRGLAINRLACQRDLADDMVNSFPQSPQSEETFSTTGCNSSFRRDALLAIGGFDEAFVYFLDESDVNMRLMDAGGRQTFALEAEVHHKYAPSSLRQQDHTPRNLYPSARSLAYFCARHGLARHGVADVVERLEAFRHEYRKQIAGLVEQRRLATTDREKLENDILMGLRDGLELAADVSHRSTNKPFAYPSPEPNGDFLRFSILKPSEERLRIAFLSQEAPTVGKNGIAVWTRSLANILAAAGHDVSVISQSQDGEARVDFHDGVWVHEVAKPNFAPPAQWASVPKHIWNASLAAAREIARIDTLRGLDFVSGPIWDLETVALKGYTQVPVCVSLHTTYAMASTHKPEWRANGQQWGNSD